MPGAWPGRAHRSSTAGSSLAWSPSLTRTQSEAALVGAEVLGRHPAARTSCSVMPLATARLTARLLRGIDQDHEGPGRTGAGVPRRGGAVRCTTTAWRRRQLPSYFVVHQGVGDGFEGQPLDRVGETTAARARRSMWPSGPATPGAEAVRPPARRRYPARLPGGPPGRRRSRPAPRRPGPGPPLISRSQAAE